MKKIRNFDDIQQVRLYEISVERECVITVTPNASLRRRRIRSYVVDRRTFVGRRPNTFLRRRRIRSYVVDQVCFFDVDRERS